MMKKLIVLLLTAALLLSCFAAPAGAANLAQGDYYVLGRELAVGDVFFFGHFEQDGDRNNGAEPIVWVVLNVDHEQQTAFVVSRLALECRQYHSKNTNISWAGCDLRRWLNNEFYGAAFDLDERECIVPMMASGVEDRVTIPDESTVYRYGLSADGCNWSSYTAGHGADIATDNNKTCWWVRIDEASSKGDGMYVGRHGGVYTSNKVTIKNNCVLPVMTVSIPALMSCPNTSGYTNRASTIAFTNQKLATRVGPDTNYDECHTYNLGNGAPVYVLRQQTTNGTPWVELEILYGGGWRRVWTGLKRVDDARGTGLTGDYEVIGSGSVAEETEGKYGPGDSYDQLYKKVPVGTNVDVLCEENGWLLIQYHVTSDKLIRRTWVPAYMVSMW